MSSLVRSEAGDRKTAKPQGVQRPSAERPREQFMQPFTPDIITIPVKLPSSVPSKPRHVEPWSPKDRSTRRTDRQDRIRKTAERLQKKAKAEAERLERLKKAKLSRALKFAKRGNAYALAFQLGWEIGDYLFPVGWWTPFPGAPDQSTYPDGWNNPDWSYNDCPNNAALAGCYGGNQATIAYRDSFAPVPRYGCKPWGGLCNTSSTYAGGDTTMMPDIPSVLAQVAGNNTFEVYRQWVDNSRWYRVGTYAPIAFPPDNDLWVQDLLGNGNPMPLTSPRYSEHPETFPIGQPMPHPVPQPWKEASTGEEPSKSEAPGRSLSPLTVPLVPFPLVEVIPPGGTVPTPPVQSIDIPPPGQPGHGGGFARTYPPRSHNRREPPKSKRVKEKKLNVQRFAFTWAALNLATEWFDFIDSLFQGLPEDVRRATGATIDTGRKGGGNADPYAKARAIYEHFDEIDWNAATKAFLNNQIEDMAYGLLGTAGSKANAGIGAATGTGGAVFSRPGKFADAAAAQEGEEFELPVPTLEWNYETGAWELTIPLSKAGFDTDIVL